MKKKSVNIVLISFFILSLLIIPFYIKHDINFLSDSPIKLQGKFTLPINITHNDNFSLYDSGGDGNASTPWIIENYVINASGFGCHGVFIANTTDYFILQNCTIIEADGTYHGMRLENVSNGKIRNNTVADNAGNGIYLYQSSNNIISHNSFYLAKNPESTLSMGKDVNFYKNT